MNDNRNDFNSYQEDITNIASKEQEIKDLYDDTVLEEEIVENKEADLEEDFIEEKDYDKKQKKTKRIINIIFGIIILVAVLVATDIILVSKFDVGPFFSIPLHTYKDGGSKEYYGLGYKVIKYHQIQGRRDRELGSYSLKYNVNPITVQDVDMAIEFSEDTSKAYEKYYKKFVRIISTLKKVDEKKHQITIGYQDEGKKYSLIIKCDMVKEQKNINKFETGKEITIIGTVKSFKPATKKNANTIYISNCFAEQ